MDTSVRCSVKPEASATTCTHSRAADGQSCGRDLPARIACSVRGQERCRSELSPMPAHGHTSSAGVRCAIADARRRSAGTRRRAVVVCLPLADIRRRSASIRPLLADVRRRLAGIRLGSAGVRFR